MKIRAQGQSMIDECLIPNHAFRAKRRTDDLTCTDYEAKILAFRHLVVEAVPIEEQ